MHAFIEADLHQMPNAYNDAITQTAIENRMCMFS